MSIRRSHKDFVKSELKASRVRMHATRMRERVKASMNAATERTSARLSWWSRTFRTPLVGFYGWVRSRCQSLWAACLTILGFSTGAAVKPLARRHGQVRAAAKKAHTRRLIHETMEARQLLAADLQVIANDTFAQEDPSASPFPNTGQFILQLDVADTEDIAVTYSLTGTANSEFGIDYIAEVSSAPIGKTGVITIPAGKTQAVVDIDVQDDDLYDNGNETVILSVSGAQQVGGAMKVLTTTKASDTMNIVDNETAAPTVSISATKASAAEPSTSGEFTLTQSVKSDTDTTVSIGYSGTAHPTDFTGASSLKIAAGSTQAATLITPTADVLVEGPETVVATIGTVTSINGVTKAGGPATVTITDTQDEATLKISNNGDGKATEALTDNAAFTISMDNPSSTSTVVKYNVAVGGTNATEGVDYTFGVINEVESNDTTAGPQPASNGPQGLAGFSLAANPNISNSTTVPHVTVRSRLATNGAGDGVDVYAFYTSTGGVATFDIDASGGFFDSVIELIDTDGVTVLASNDDSLLPSLDPGTSSTLDSFLTFNLPSDGVYYLRVTEFLGPEIEFGESYDLHLSVPGSQGYAVIGAGSTSVDLPVVINDADYSFDDLIIEANEKVSVSLDSIKLADPQIAFSKTASDLTSLVTITDNDAVAVTVTGTKNGLETKTTPVDGEFTIAFPAGFTSSTNTVVVLEFDSSSTAKNAATAKLIPLDTQDHTLADVTTVTILAGKNSTTLNVGVLDNKLIEEDEFVTVEITNLLSPTDTDISGLGNTGTLKIGDNDTAVVDVDATFNPAVENTKVGKFTFFLSEPPGYPTGDPATADRDTTVTFQISDIVNNVALGLGVDYTIMGATPTATPGIYSVTIPKFSSSADVEVKTIDDPQLEGTETLKFEIKTLEAPTDSNITIGIGSPSDTMDILDDDGLTVKIVGTKHAVENSVDGEFTLSTFGMGTTLSPVTVTYEVVTKLSTAIEGADFTTLTKTATIPAGVAPQSTVISIATIDDPFAEGTEIVTVKITGVTGTGISIDAMDQDSRDIIDDETNFVDITNTVDGFESFKASKNGSFDVTLGGTSSSPVVVEYQIFNLPPTLKAASPGDDYKAIGTGTVTIDAFTSSKTIPVEVINDLVGEGVENVDIKVSKVISGPYTPGASGQVQIFSDVVVSVVALDPTAQESNGPGINDGAFALYMKYADALGVAATSDLDTVVTYSILTGNANDASNGTDYAALTGVATIKAGQTSAVIAVDVENDITLESTENVRLRLTGITSGEADVKLAGTASGDTVRNATVTISDNDAAFFTVKATKTPGQDNPGSDVDGEFTVFASQPSDVATVVTYAVSPTSTATSGTGNDYAKLSGTVTIPAGKTSATISVDVFDDLNIENTETVTIKLQNPAAFTDGKALPSYAGNRYLGALGATFISDGVSTVVSVATEDTFVDSGQDTTNFGAIPALQAVNAKVGSSIVERHSLVKFGDLSGTGFNQVPTGSPILNASLQLTPFTGAGNDDVVVYELLAGFNESGATWNSPLLGGNGLPGIQADGFDVDLLPTTKGLMGSGLKVTSDAQAWINGGTNFGWAILPQAFGDSANAFSSESLAPPLLTITLDGSATVEIVDNDTATLQVVSSTPATEPGGTGTIVVALVDGFGNQVKADNSVSFTYLDTTLAGTAPVATPISDYQALPLVGSIAAGSKSTAINIIPNDDSLIEPTENVSIELKSANSVDPDIKLGTKVAGSTVIIDNDFGFVTIAATKNGNEDTPATMTDPFSTDPSDGKFTVSLSSPSSVDTVVEVTTSGTATSGADYAAIAKTVTIPANQTSATILVDVIDDGINEANPETVKLQLGTVVSGNTAIGVGIPSQATVTITDDEQPLTASVVATKATAIEQLPGSFASQDGELQIVLNFPSDKETVIEYTITGTAEDDDPGAITGGVEPDYDATQFPGLDLKTLPINEALPGTNLVGKITIAAGKTNAIFPVDVFNDFVVDGPESVVLKITSAKNSNGISVPGATDTGTVTILDGIYQVKVEKTDSPASEPGPPGGSNGQFTFSITAPLPEPTVVNYSVLGSSTASATIDPLSGKADYKALSGVVTIPANTTQFTLDVTVIDDLLLEDDETIDIQLTSATSAGASYIYGAPAVSVDATIASETIQDNDSATLSVAGLNGMESGQPNKASDGKFVITQTLPASVGTVITYVIDTGASSATAGADYAAISGTKTATILKGQTQVVIDVDVLDDTTVELTENVAIKLTGITSSDPQVSFASKTASLDIIDDDTASVSILGISNGFEPGTNDGKFLLQLSAASSTPTVVTFSPNSGDAVMGTDFVLRDSTSTGALLTNMITIPANQTQAIIVVDVLDDGIVEDAETVKLAVVSTDNAKIGAATGTATVSIFPDNDNMKISIAKTTDGVEGGVNGVYTLTLANANPGSVLPALSSDENTEITYSIMGGTATTGGKTADHTLASTGTVTILAGQTQATITVPVVDDNLAELAETLTVSLGSVTKGHSSLITPDAGKSSATLSILDNDASKLTITSPTVTEGDTGTKNLTFTVTSPTAVAGGFSVDYKVTDLTTNKFGGADYGGASGTLGFTGAAGETKTITFTVNGDNLVEADEQFEVKLNNPPSGSPLVIDGAVGTATIINNDKATFKINDVSVVEGSSGSPQFNPNFTDLKFTVSVDNPIDIDTVVDIDFGDLTAFGGDFDPLLALASPNNKIPVSITGFDYDNDASEKANSSGSYKSGTLSKVTWLAGESTPGNAINPALVTKEFTVRVVQDNIVEGGVGTPNPMGTNDPGVETFEATIAADKAGIRNIDTSDKGKGTIVDDDSGEIYIDLDPTSKTKSDLKASEPLDTVNEGGAQFVIIQTAISDSDTVITYDVTGTADHKGSDYTPLTGTVTVVAGKTSAVVDVTVVDSLELEDDETVTITITGFASRDPNITEIAMPTTDKALSATANIFDDDQALVTVEATDADASEDPLDDGEFTLTLSGVSDTDTVVTYQMLNPSIANPERATNGADYKFLSGSATIPAGQTQTTILVDVVDDVVVEGAEDVIIKLTGTASPSNADIKIGGVDQATVVIADDIDGILISVMNNGDATEGTTPGSASIPGSFVIKLTKSDGITPVMAPAGGLTINYSSANPASNAATAGSGPGADYTALSGTLFIPAGATTGLIDVNVNNDSIVEGTETVKVTLQPPVSGYAPIGGESVNVGQASAIVNIIDDDSVAPKVESTTINDGEAQRSGLKTIEIVIDQPVAVAAGAIKVLKRDDLAGGLVTVGEVGGVIVATDLVAQPGKTVITLTFTPNSTFVDAGGNLVDGNYQLEITDSLVTSIAGGNFLDGDNSGVGGGDYVFGQDETDKFYRLYGDADGDEDVDFDDMFGMLFPHVGTTSASATFADHLDGDNDGDIDFDDMFAEMFPAVGQSRDKTGFPN